MLRSSDLIRLPYPPDLTQAGVAIASLRLAASNTPSEGIDIGKMQAEVAQAGVALALRRYLLERRIPFQYLESNPFSEPEQVTVVLGGRKLAIEIKLVSDQNTVQRLSADPDLVFATRIQIPAWMQSSDLYSGSDLAVFAIAAARVTRDRSELLRAAQAGEPFLCSHVMPEAWRKPGLHRIPGQLSFRYAGETPMVFTLYGLDLQQGHCVEQITIHPQAGVKSKYKYRSLSSLHASAIPTVKVGIESPAHRNAYTIMPLQWRNLWIYGQEIIICGYLPFEEVWNFSRATHPRQLGLASTLEMPLANLHSLPLFLEQVAARQ